MWEKLLANLEPSDLEQIREHFAVIFARKLSDVQAERYDEATLASLHYLNRAIDELDSAQ